MAEDISAKTDPGGTEEDRKPDVQAIMASIRERVKAELEKHPDIRTPFRTYTANSDQGASRPAGELLRSEDLRFLNTHHNFASALRIDSITTHRRGFLGRLLVRIKQKFGRMLRYSIFAEYFASEAEFSLNLVRFLNDVSKYVDARDGAIFWELIRKIDHDVSGALERIERISDEQMATLRSTEKDVNERFNTQLREISKRLGETAAEVARHDAELKTLDSVARGLEGLMARASKAAPVQAAAAAPAARLPEASYILLENRYRGSEEEIRARLQIYPALFGRPEKPVLEIGPGRGELLALFKAAGVPAYGVDSDAAMVEAASAKGLDVRPGDGIAHLAELPPASLGGLVAIQVVEHLSQETLQKLFALAREKVAAGGRVVFETINPQSLSALSSNYFRDPTHVWPLHPDTLSYGMTLAGLKVLEVRKLSPVPQEAQLRGLPAPEYLTPRWRETIELLNTNWQKLNDLLYGFQDYCVIGEVP